VLCVEHRQIALLRDTSPLPIVYTVRSVGQIGKFPAEPERIFALLREGLRAGIEWMDVEACWPADQVTLLTSDTEIAAEALANL
jgi:pentafunctional AROM polypeptide